MTSLFKKYGLGAIVGLFAAIVTISYTVKNTIADYNQTRSYYIQSNSSDNFSGIISGNAGVRRYRPKTILERKSNSDSKYQELLDKFDKLLIKYDESIAYTRQVNTSVKLLESKVEINNELVAGLEWELEKYKSYANQQPSDLIQGNNSFGLTYEPKRVGTDFQLSFHNPKISYDFYSQYTQIVNDSYWGNVKSFNNYKWSKSFYSELARVDFLFPDIQRENTPSKLAALNRNYDDFNSVIWNY